MLSWSLSFFVLALVAAFFGFTGIASAMTGIAQLLFILFIILFVLSLLFRGAQKVDDVVDRTL